MVTHPFHPLLGKEFTLVTYRFNWGEDRVYYYDHDDELKSLPARWTSVIPEDPFVKISQGKAPFQLHDLIELSQLIENIEHIIHEQKKEHDA